MTEPEAVDRNIYRGCCPPSSGSVGRLLADFGAQVVVGHPTFRNADNIGRELGRGIGAVSEVYAGEKVAFVVSDGTFTLESPDASTLEAAVAGARHALSGLAPADRDRVLTIVTPYDGYLGGRTPGKGSALKLIFEEMALIPSARKLILLDGDLRNELKPWFAVFARLEAHHRERRPDREFFVTARYARHFVDASLTRFVVGPLTTLMGQYVPGGISGDIVLSAGAVAHERRAAWDDHRRRYGTDIATTFDNIADPQVEIYEAYLGAKLHDITDEAKLSVMPGEVIGEALARLLHYEDQDGRISRLLEGTAGLRRPTTWGPELTGIGFIDPGYTDVFDVDLKRRTLLTRFESHAEAMQTVLEPATWETVQAAHATLTRAGEGDGDPVLFLNVHRTLWLEILSQAVARVLSRREIETAKHCLNYLYTAAFLEFCREKIMELGGRTLGEVRRMQHSLGVPGESAERFYRERVDAVVTQMAMDFFAGRQRILTHLRRGAGS